MINATTMKPPEVPEEALEVGEPGVDGMIVTVTVTAAEIHTEGDEVDLEVPPVDMVGGM
jgi:hypothetical protein